MQRELETWERKLYVPGGGTPFLFYVVYGKVDWSVPISASRYRCGGVPEGIQLLSYGPDKHPDVVSSFRSGYLWDKLLERDPSFAESIAATDHCLILRGSPVDDTTLNYFRDSIGLLTYLLDAGARAIFDPLMFYWWSPNLWKERIFEPAGPVPRHHVMMLYSNDGDDPAHPQKWFHTRGMRKFGRPDISIHGVPSHHEDAILDLCNRLIEHQAFGHVVPEGQEVWMSSLPAGGIIRYTGDLDDPDFNNVHIEIRWPEEGLG